MPKPSKAKNGFTAADTRAVSDNPEWTKADFAKAKRFDEVFPDLAKTIRQRGKQKAPTKEAVSLRLSRDVLNYFRSSGPGWQTRINDELQKLTARKRRVG